MRFDESLFIDMNRQHAIADLAFPWEATAV
jgi:hypothetical protein